MDVDSLLVGTYSGDRQQNLIDLGRNLETTPIHPAAEWIDTGFGIRERVLAHLNITSSLLLATPAKDLLHLALHEEKGPNLENFHCLLCCFCPCDHEPREETTGTRMSCFQQQLAFCLLHSLSLFCKTALMRRRSRVSPQPVPSIHATHKPHKQNKKR